MFQMEHLKERTIHNFFKRSLIHPKKTVKGIAYRGNTTVLDVKNYEEWNWSILP